MIPIADFKIDNPKRATEAQTGRASWYPYYAGFSIDFAKTLLASATLAPASAVIDPWNGSGTTTAAAAGMGHYASGFDLNPVMVLAAKARTLSKRERISLRPLAEAVTKLMGMAGCAKDDPLTLWFTDDSAAVVRRLEQSLRKLLLPPQVAFVDDTIKQISDLAAFFYVVLFRTVRYLLSSRLGSNPTWIKKPKLPSERLSPSETSILSAFRTQVSTMADAIIHDQFRKDSEVTISIASSEKLPLSNSSADFILSSPPYCTRIDYAVATLPELAVLGFPEAKVDELRRTLIGSSTVPKVAPPVNERWGRTCLGFLDKIEKHDSKASKSYYLKNHLQYFDSMFASLREVSRIMTDSAACVLVVQDSYYKEHHNDLPTIISEMAMNCGLAEKRRVNFENSRTMALVNPEVRRYRKKIKTTEAVIVCRVRRRPCDHLLPSEPDVKVSLHPAQAIAKPRVSEAGFHDVLTPACWREMPYFF